MKSLLLATALTVLAATAAQADQKHIIGLRETVGSVQINGWEQGLVQTNPNLGHWHWTPMYANVQRIRTYGDPNAASQVPQKVAREPNIPPPHYVKPIQLPMPIPQWKKDLAKMDQMPPRPRSIENRTDSNSQSNISGLLISRKPPTVASYSGDYTSAPTLHSSERTSVRGRLTSPRI